MNAQEEFLEHIKGRKLVCANIWLDADYGKNIKQVILKHHFTKQEFADFSDKLNFEYDSGYGGQQLYGRILFEDSYSDRGEYDGSEWWENHKMPTITEILELNPH